MTTAPKPRRGPLAGYKALRPVRPSAGLELAYRKRLEAMLHALHRSLVWWIAAEYKKHPPALAQDASPFEWLQKLVRRLRNRWLKKIDEAAPKIAEYFATAVQKRSDKMLKKILKESGFTIGFQKTPAMQDAWAASVHENVSLIKSIPRQYLDQVEQSVSRAYSNGYDMKRLSDELQERFKVSKKRATFIARDQTSKLSSQMARVRAIENGITHAIWRHSHAGKSFRRTHLEMDGEPFELAKGMWDPDPKVKAWIQPGFLPNCKCVHRMLIPYGNAWKNNNPNRSTGFVKPVKEQKIYKGYPGKA